MPHYERFIFESFELDSTNRRILLRYSLDGTINFEETVQLPDGLALNAGHPDLPSALLALHLAGGASYYKTWCPRTIEIKSGRLNAGQAAFWNTLYTHGLGEFFYRNRLDFHGLINFPTETPGEGTGNHPTQSPGPADSTPQHLLVPFGGGKDSLVTMELLRKTDADQTLFRLRGHRLITELAATAGLPLIVPGRTLDPKLFELNEAGAYNGHVPITAYISFLSIVVALLAGFDGVVFSSERSSSYGNVDYLGMEINHQWSKTQVAETLVRNYISRFITGKVAYLNLVRPLSELHIAKLFAKYPQYFPVATSCNRNWLLSARDEHAGHWCGTCPKCAFTFALLAAWLPEPTVTKIFGHNLFEDTGLRPLYRELWGLEGFKPFECVGTPEETAAAFYLARTKPGFAGTAMMNEFARTMLPTLKAPDALVKELLTPETGLASPASARLLKQAGVL